MSQTLPATMTAVEIRKPGGPEGLVPGERPVPQPGEGEVLIKVAAAGVNRPDVLQRQVQAAALPETFFTVWVNVFERSALKPGESLLVHGGTSGIGTTAIQLAKALGSRVFATAGSAEKVKACEELGAERGINYREEDFVEVVKEATGGKGVDVILDMVGGDYIPRDIKALAEDGRLSFIAFLGGPKAEVNFAAVMMKRLTITGSTLRARPVAVKAALAKALSEKVWPLLEAGKIAPVMAASFPLAEAAKAHALMESSGHIGKIVLTLE
jgi:NADPH2:quinone reductase